MQVESEVESEEKKQANRCRPAGSRYRAARLRYLRIQRAKIDAWITQSSRWRDTCYAAESLNRTLRADLQEANDVIASWVPYVEEHANRVNGVNA